MNVILYNNPSRTSGQSTSYSSILLYPNKLSKMMAEKSEEQIVRCVIVARNRKDEKTGRFTSMKIKYGYVQDAEQICSALNTTYFRLNTENGIKKKG